MKKGISIPVLFRTEQQDTQERIGIDIDLQKCEVRNITFFSINGITDYTEYGKYNYCEIYANGDYFISPWSVTHVYNIIEQIWNL